MAASLLVLPGGKASVGTLPVTPEVEAALLWCFLNESAAWVRFGEWIEPAYFSTGASLLVQHLTLYAGAHGGRVPSSVVLGQIVRGVLDAGKIAVSEYKQAVAVLELGEGLQDAGKIQPDELYEAVADVLRKRHAEAAAVDVIPKLVHGDGDRLRAAAVRLQKVADLGSAALDPGVRLGDPVSLERALREGRSAGGRVPTGIYSLDQVLRGGLGCGELGTLLGGTGVGKSIALNQVIAAALHHGRNVALVTLELSDVDCYVRLFGALLDQDTTDLQDRMDSGEPDTRQAAEHEMLAHLAGHLAQFKCGSLVVRYFAAGTPWPVLRGFFVGEASYLDAAGAHLDLAAVDYGDLVGTPKSEDREENKGHLALARLWRAMRSEIAVDLSCAVWTASQAKRGVRKKDLVDEEDVADGMGKSRESDVVVGLCQTTEEAVAGTVRLHVCKNRKREAHQVLGPFPVGYARGRLVGESGS